jgi:hypothetical protein
MLVRYEDDLLLHLHESSLHKATAAAIVVVVQVIRERERRKLKRRRTTRKWSCRQRQRRPVLEVYQELGDPYFRRAYRMNYSSFAILSAYYQTVFYWHLARKMFVPTSFTTEEFGQKFALHVLYVGLPVAHHTTS